MPFLAGMEKKVDVNPIQSLKENHYSSPIEANTSARLEVNRQPLRPSPKLTSSDSLSSAVKSPVSSSYPTGKNPFEEDLNNESSSNPFEEKAQKNTNPFADDDDYEDENLNPFYNN